MCVWSVIMSRKPRVLVSRLVIPIHCPFFLFCWPLRRRPGAGRGGRRAVVDRSRQHSGRDRQSGGHLCRLDAARCVFGAGHTRDHSMRIFKYLRSLIHCHRNAKNFGVRGFRRPFFPSCLPENVKTNQCCSSHPIFPHPLPLFHSCHLPSALLSSGSRCYHCLRHPPRRDGAGAAHQSSASLSEAGARGRPVAGCVHDGAGTGFLLCLLRSL